MMKEASEIPNACNFGKFCCLLLYPQNLGGYQVAKGNGQIELNYVDCIQPLLYPATLAIYEPFGNQRP